jgi:hypothetical protein
MSGEVSVRVDLPNGQIKRLSTLSPGMAFGEIAVINRSVRSADVHAGKPQNATCCQRLRSMSWVSPQSDDASAKLLRNFWMLTMVEREVTTLAW